MASTEGAEKARSISGRVSHELAFAGIAMKSVEQPVDRMVVA